jgi:superfamily II DNA or RNA helicase
MSGFQYYPNIKNNNNFNKKLLSKLEFRNIFDKEESKYQKLFPQQEFLKQYISVDTPYNGILIFHGTGVGKTCTAINIAEGFKEYATKTNKKIIILSSSVVKTRFIEEIYNFNKDELNQCIGDVYIKDSFLANKTLSEKKKILGQKIKKIYEFYGYLEFANIVKRKYIKTPELSEIDKSKIVQRRIRKEFSDRIIIVDEIHNLRKSNTNIDNKKASIILEAIVKYATNIKLILMSATPMYDNATEIIYILNLLLLNDNRPPIKHSDIFTGHGLTPNAIDVIRKNSKGYISYIRSERPFQFPFRIIPPEAKLLKYKYDYKGNKLSTTDNLKYTHLYPCDLSKEHYSEYIKLYDTLDDTLDDSNKSSASNKSTDADKHNVFLNTATKYNIIYPTGNKGKYVTGSMGYQKTKNSIGGFYYNKEKKNRVFKYQSHAYINKIPFMDIKNISTFSSKFSNLLNNVIKSTGKIFIYVSEIWNGIIPLSLMLEQNGYVRHTCKNELPYLNSKHKSKPRCYKCGLFVTDKIHYKKHKDYHEFKIAKYISLSSDNSININSLITKFNNKSNTNGEEIKIIIGTRILSEGIDVKCIRQLHILDTWYNISRLEQIVGRSIRTNSHIDLDPINHNVEIFIYVNTPYKSSSEKNNTSELIDVNIYRIAEAKDIMIKKIEHILKNNAVDCGLFQYMNIIYKDQIIPQITSRGFHINYNIKDKPYSRICDYMDKCELKCNFNISNSDLINTNTFNIINKTSEIMSLKYKIKGFIKNTEIFTLQILLNYIDESTLSSIYILYKALNDIIQNKEKVIFNKINGTLTYYNAYYIFLSNNIKNSHTPLHYRSVILNKRVKYIDINDSDIDISSNNSANININIEEILAKYNHLIKKYTNILKKITKIDNIILLEMILDTYNKDVIEHLVNLYHKSPEDNILHSYFKQIYISTKTTMVINKYKYVKLEDSIKVSNKVYVNPTSDLPLEYGIFDNKMNKFKIVDSTLDKNIKTQKDKISKKAKSNGRVCETFDSKYILNIFNRLLQQKNNINPDVHISKKVELCNVIEYMFRYLKVINDSSKYFIYIK